VSRGADADPLVVVVDMQDVFGDPASPWATPGFDELIGPIEELVAAAGDRTVFTRFVLPDRIEGSWAPYYVTWDEVTQPGRAAWFELAEPWRSRGVATLDVPRFSKWPELASTAGPDGALLVCGVATDCCVIATALAAADAGRFVRVVADACRGVDAAAHDRAIALMAGFTPHIEITSVDQELASLRRDASRSA
jgi:nicotinamidase-related amidase